MVSRRVIFLSLLFPILLAGFLIASPLLYPHTLRRDPVPQGAYVVPWMRPQTSITLLRTLPESSLPWNLTGVMMGALSLKVTFTVVFPNETRTLPSTIYLGHDLQFLYVGGIFANAFWNPTSTPKSIVLDNFNMLFDVDGDGLLTYPEAGSNLGLGICPPYATNCGSTYNSAGWGYPCCFAFGDQGWMANPGWDRWSGCPGPAPHNSFGDVVFEYNNKTGTIAAIFARYLAVPNYACDGMQIKLGERWTMGFVLEFGYNNGNSTAPYNDFVGDWPRQAYPFLTNDASWWPKLSIDLANPPANLG